MKHKFKILIYLLLTLSLIFFTISCEEDSDEGLSCSDYTCSENSHCETNINNTPYCICDQDYTQIGEDCIKNDEIETYQLFVTGETQTIAENDDGNTQRGLQRAYKEELNLIIDTRTGLTWQNDTKTDNMNLKDAKTHCENLNLENKIWRLPNLKELLSLVDLKFSPTVNPVFISIGDKKYLTNTKFNEYSYSINFNTGDIELLGGEDTAEVICVNGDFINKNKKPNLTWEDFELNKDNVNTWKEAISYCENLEFNTYSDWHLPNINELYTIIEETNIPYQYWSSTVSKNQSIKTLDMENHHSSLSDEDASLNIICVRQNTNTFYQIGEWGDIILNERYTIPKNTLFIDIRTEGEIASGIPSNSVSGAVYSSSDPEGFISDIERISDNDKTKHIILTCASSGRSSSAVKLLSENGFKYIEHIIGGTNKWKSLELDWEN